MSAPDRVIGRTSVLCVTGPPERFNMDHALRSIVKRTQVAAYPDNVFKLSGG